MPLDEFGVVDLDFLQNHAGNLDISLFFPFSFFY